MVNFSDKTSDPTKFPDRQFRYIEITNINNSVAQIDSFKDSIGRKAKSRARRSIEEGNILVSTTRPNRGAMAIVTEYHHNDIASTGFQIMNANDSQIRECLLTLLRTQFCLTQLWGRSTGSGYPEITRDELRQILIPNLTDPDPATIASKLRGLENSCQIAKLSLNELALVIEKRLNGDVADTDVLDTCQNLEQNVTQGAVEPKSKPIINDPNGESTLTDYF